MTWLLCDSLSPYKIEKQQVMLGRGEECDLVLNHKAVSRNHAVIKNLGNQRHVVCDLASSNGTFVNGRQITRHILKYGDEIKVGTFSFKLSDKTRDFASKTDSFTASKKYSMVGQLENQGLVEVFQYLEFNKKTGTLSIRHDLLGEGFVTFQNGSPMAAQFAGETAEGAILAMLRLGEGYFMTSNEIEPAEADISSNFTNILLEHLRLIDESRRAESTDLDILRTRRIPRRNF